MAVDSDGYLWVSGATDVLRFDGVSFTPLTRQIEAKRFQDGPSSMIAAEGGGIWLGDFAGAPLLSKNGRLTAFAAAAGYVGDGVVDFYRSLTGHVRAISDTSIQEFRAGKWHQVIDFSPDHAAFDTDGHEWMVKGDELWIRTTQAEKPQIVPGMPNEVRKVIADPNGLLFVSNFKGVSVYQRRGVKLTEAFPQIALEVPQDMAQAQDGSLWIGGKNGLFYVSVESLKHAIETHTGPQVQRLTKNDGLTANFVSTITADDAGEIWVATNSGVDLFYPADFVSLPLPEPMNLPSVASDVAGNVWVGSSASGIYRRDPEGSWHVVDKNHFTLSMTYDSAHDIVWDYNGAGLWRLSRDRAKLITPKPYPDWTGQINSLFVDASGSVYVMPPQLEPARGPPRKWDGTQWSDLPRVPGTIATGAFDAAGNLWMAVAHGARILRLKKGAYETLGASNGLTTGEPAAITPDGEGLWIGGANGVQYLQAGHLYSLPFASPDLESAVSGILIDSDGYLWIRDVTQVYRSRVPNVARLLQRSVPVAFDVYTPTDGIGGDGTNFWATPSLRQGGDGRIWVQSITAITSIDPKRLTPTPPARTPEIYAATVGGVGREIRGGLVQLTAQERDLRLEYTSPTLSRPDQTVFEYRLRGLDDRWQAAGLRREASFTNLPAGKYRFEVRAVAKRGQASDVAFIEVTREPSLSETWWFRSLLVCILPAGLLIILVMRHRARENRARIRADEREAVARDIHDTLLQRMQGMVLSIQAWATEPGISGRKKEEALAIAQDGRDAIIEGREQILILRSAADAGLHLYAQVAEAGRMLSERHNMLFSSSVTGVERRLNANVATELQAICMEALRNAFTHSAGTRVSLRLQYEPDAFWAVVFDDGIGLNAAERAAAVQRGHVGLLGLEERVRKINGTLRIDTASREGTEIHVRIPARTAYAA